MSPYDCLTVQDFDRSSLATHHWLDEPRNMDGRKSKRCDPNTVFKVFARFEDIEDHKLVRQNMVSTITTEFNWYSDMALVCLQMHKTTLSKWIDKMQDPRQPADELAVYALSRIYNQHSVTYTKTKTWSSMGTTRPLSEKELYDSCKVKFVNMGKGKLVELVSKPSSLMPVVRPTPLLSTYESGYYETEPVNVPEIKEEPQDDYLFCNNQNMDPELAHDNVVESEPAPQSSSHVPELEHDELERPEAEHAHTTRCLVHGCDTMDKTYSTLGNTVLNPSVDHVEEESTTPLLFPSSMEVCDTGINSALNEFNPLIESEPNLDLGNHDSQPCMTDQNTGDVTLRLNDMIVDAKTKNWTVPVRKLSLEEVEFLSGPKLLPNLTIPTIPTVPDPESDMPLNIISRPRRNVKKSVNYSDQCVDEDEGEEYVPDETELKLKNNNKKSSSSESEENIPLSKLVSKKSSDDSDDLPLSELREHEEDNTPLSVLQTSASSRKSKKPLRCFKCKFSDAVEHSQKDLNNHHKQSHGRFSCPDCDEVYDTPSGLHRHSYRHKELKFKCSKCGDKFPFQSQLDDHLIKHVDKRAHSCASCTKKFKNASSLRKHALVHDGQKHHCDHKKCDYWSYDRRNVDAHKYSNHSTKDRYGCDKCGETFKHHTQMAHHVDNNKCSK